jgi:hypothetical protein
MILGQQARKLKELMSPSEELSAISEIIVFAQKLSNGANHANMT